MISHGTLGIKSAGAGARVETLLMDARLVSITVIVNKTLWPAAWRRAKIAWVTSTLGPVTDTLT